MRDDLKTRFTKLEFAASYLFEDLVKNLQAELGHIKTSMRGEPETILAYIF